MFLSVGTPSGVKSFLRGSLRVTTQHRVAFLLHGHEREIEIDKKRLRSRKQRGEPGHDPDCLLGKTVEGGGGEGGIRSNQ